MKFEEAVEARAAKQVLGGVSNILHGADELRNARGTGHGRSGSPIINDALARLAVGAVLPAVVYLIEIYEARTSDAPALTLLTSGATPPLAPAASLAVGGVVRHDTYGEGQVKELTGVGDRQVAEIDFGAEAGVKNAGLPRGIGAGALTPPERPRSSDTGAMDELRQALPAEP